MKRLILMMLLVSMGGSAATWQLVYPRQLSEQDTRSEYPVKLLSLALEATGVNYSLMASDRILLQSDAIQKLKLNRDINVLWSMTDKQREEEMLPIRIPIYKGLIGTRLLLIRAANQSMFDGIGNLEQLAEIRAVSGQTWPDTKILQANGIDVVTDPDYEPLFKLLDDGQGRMFPRSVIEIYDELAKHNDDGELMIEPSLALYYPTAIYFFVNRNDVALKRLIEAGLNKIIANGKFEQLFVDMHAPILERANLDERTLLRLQNPVLPQLTPTQRNELWHSVAFE